MKNKGESSIGGGEKEQRQTSNGMDEIEKKLKRIKLEDSSYYYIKHNEIEKDLFDKLRSNGTIKKETPRKGVRHKFTIDLMQCCSLHNLTTDLQECRPLLNIFQILQQYHEIFSPKDGKFKVEFELKNLWKDFKNPPVISLWHQDKVRKGFEKQIVFTVNGSMVDYSGIEKVFKDIKYQVALARFLFNIIKAHEFPISLENIAPECLRTLDDTKKLKVMNHIYYLLWLLFCVESVPGRVGSFDVWIISILHLFVEDDEKFLEIYGKCLEIIKNALQSYGEQQFQNLEELIMDGCQCFREELPAKNKSEYYKICDHTTSHDDCLCRGIKKPNIYVEKFFEEWIKNETEIGLRKPWPNEGTPSRVYPDLAPKSRKRVTTNADGYLWKLMDICGDHSAVFPSGRRLELGQQIVQNVQWKEMEQKVIEKILSG